MYKIIIGAIIVFLLVFGGMYYFLHTQETSVNTQIDNQRGDTVIMSGSSKKIISPVF